MLWLRPAIVSHARVDINNTRSAASTALGIPNNVTVGRMVRVRVSLLERSGTGMFKTITDTEAGATLNATARDNKHVVTARKIMLLWSWQRAWLPAMVRWRWRR